jgi:hypothetical protein
LLNVIEAGSTPFTEYGVRPEDVTGLRHRFAACRADLLAS